MRSNKVKIVLDADVLIHFQKAGYLSLLPTILPEYECVVLSVVYGELASMRSQLDNQVHLMKNISLENFSPTGDMAREYAILSSRFGRGESACMAYCRFNHDVLGSSNLRDISDRRTILWTGALILFFSIMLLMGLGGARRAVGLK